MSKACYAPALLFVIDGTKEAYIGSSLQNILFLSKPVWPFPLVFNMSTKFIYLAAFFLSYYIYEMIYSVPHDFPPLFLWGERNSYFCLVQFQANPQCWSAPPWATLHWFSGSHLRRWWVSWWATCCSTNESRREPSPHVTSERPMTIIPLPACTKEPPTFFASALATAPAWAKPT